jgi:hypothetical protein
VVGDTVGTHGSTLHSVTFSGQSHLWKFWSNFNPSVHFCETPLTWPSAQL